ncbi:hypothetical protein SAY86_018367 [Trapa natans]|uniref:CCT domain-containing protein n=1 Tax=Trapa natans TaxID=22666 RepID=A0AAN7LG45_TRANT|nr:hypothetical protein SAY86_018367 [Trapa natans]
MYADTGLMFPCFQIPSQEVEVQKLNDFCKSLRPDVPLLSTITEYDLGGEGDLFKAPEPIVEESTMGLDPIAAAISMISCGDDSFLSQELKVADITSIQNESLFSDVYYDYHKDLLEKAATETSFSKAPEIEIPSLKIDEGQSMVNELPLDLPFQKSVSSGCLSTVDWVAGAALKPNFLDFSGLDFGAVYGMRRAFSDGDIKNLSSGNNGYGNTSLIHSPLEQPVFVSNCTTEERLEKLSRYRNKKTRRNFGRKIKYACRKALADNQPRIRGRFARTEELNVSKKH